MINKEMFNLVTIREAKGADDIEKIAVLADKIWHEHFPALLSAEQIDYMVDKFQSFRAISDIIWHMTAMISAAISVSVKRATILYLSAKYM